MNINIKRSDDTLTSKELKRKLEELPEWHNLIKVEIQNEKSISLKSVDPSVLVAICTATGTALGVLIGGLTKIALATFKEKITIVLKDGSRIEIEARHATNKMPEIIKLFKSKDVKHIEL